MKYLKIVVCLALAGFASAGFASNIALEGGWTATFVEKGAELTLRHAASGAEIAGTLAFEGPKASAATPKGDEEMFPWKVVASRDGVPSRLALLNCHGNVDGYVTLQGSGDGVSLLVYHRTAFAYDGHLTFDAAVTYRNDAFACRIRPKADDRVLSIRSGAAVLADDDALFSPQADEALLTRGGTLSRRDDTWHFNATLAISVPESSSLDFTVVRHYYKNRWVPYYRPLDLKRAPHAPTGWLSWNTYFDQAGSKENLDEARFAAKHFKPFGMEIWNIESWQDNSDRLPVSKFYNMNLETYKVQFPEGMKWLADEIRKLGFKPGLWMAPFGTGNTNFYKAHHDWFLHRPDGKPLACWNGQFTLDPSVPEAREHLKRIFDKASHEWGYEFFKIDGMSGRGPGYCAHLYERPDVRALFKDPSCPNPFELCVKAFREGIGDDRLFLACQGHFTGAEAAYADSSRTGADIVHPWQPVRWSNLMLQARCTINQIFAHAVVFWSDPDCMLVNQAALKRSEAEVETTIVALPGQQTFAGDHLAELAADRVRLIQQALPVCPTHPAKLYPQFGHLPVWDLAISRPFGDWHVVALFNWTEEVSDIGVDWPELGERMDASFVGYEFWTESYLGEHVGSLTLSVPPHSVRLVALRPALDHPQFLSSDRHITQGGVELKNETWTGDRLVAEVEAIGGFPLTVRFAVPEGFNLKGVRAGDCKVKTRWESGTRVLAVTFASDQTAVVPVTLNF